MKIYRKYDDIEFTIVYDEDEYSEHEAVCLIIAELGNLIKY